MEPMCKPNPLMFERIAKHKKTINESMQTIQRVVEAEFNDLEKLEWDDENALCKMANFLSAAANIAEPGE